MNPQKKLIKLTEGLLAQAEGNLARLNSLETTSDLTSKLLQLSEKQATLSRALQNQKEELIFIVIQILWKIGITEFFTSQFKYKIDSAGNLSRIGCGKSIWDLIEEHPDFNELFICLWEVVTSEFKKAKNLPSGFAKLEEYRGKIQELLTNT